MVTTVHFALALLRHHRGPGMSLAIFSAVLAGMPWFLPGPAGLATGLGMHAIWFAACERFIPRPQVLALTIGTVRPRRVSVVNSRQAPDRKGLLMFRLAVDERLISNVSRGRPAGFDFTPGSSDHSRGVDAAMPCSAIRSARHQRAWLHGHLRRIRASVTRFTTLQPAMRLSVKAPAGAFVYPHGDERPMLLLAGGIGITPLLSMLRHATETEPSRAVTLLYSARGEEHFAFRDEITALARRHPQVRVVFAASQGETTAGVYPGRIDEALITTTMPGVRDAVALICGPRPMIDGMRHTLAALGMPPEDIRFERFEAAVAAAGAKAAEDHALPTSGLVAHRMRCARTGCAVSIVPGQSLLEAAEAGGVVIDSLCRSGVCGTCRTRVTDGDVECESTALDDHDREDGYVLACVTRALSDCTVDA
jgi:ferredoxin-NADP reductase